MAEQEAFPVIKPLRKRASQGESPAPAMPDALVLRIEGAAAIAGLISVLKEQNELLKTQNALIEKQNEIALSPVIPKRNEAGEIISAQKDFSEEPGVSE